MSDDPEIVGREPELGSLRTFIDEVREGPAVISLEGEAGIGKSTLWLASVRYARMRGVRVLSSRPAEAERKLAHVGLGDLFEPVLDGALACLTPPRRRALEVVLLRDEVPGDRVDERALAVAVRDVLQLLAKDTRILIAIDDVQWLDPSSSSVLAFALRRLELEPVRLLLGSRLTDGVPTAVLEHALAAQKVQRISVGPLSVGALHRVLRQRSDRPFARQTLLRIHEHSGGNPFVAIELGRALGTGAHPAAPLPVTHTIEELLRAGISGLSTCARQGLELPAAFGAMPESMLERACIAPNTLEPAATARVIERADGISRFTHPLLASVLYQDLGDKRRSVHSEIAR
jgi:hypothetical protein